MSYENRPVSEGPARDDPELGDTLAPRVTRDESAGERAGEVATTAGDRARDVASTANDEAREVVRSTSHQARRMASDARQELRNQAEAQARRLADGLDDLTRQLRSMGERGEPGPATDMVRQAGERADQLAERVRRGGVDDAVGELRNLGRNRPGLFLLGAFGLGLAGGRIARNLARDPSSGEAPTPGDGAGGRRPIGSDAARSPGRRPGTAPPRPAIVPDAGLGNYAVTDGHAAYGAPGPYVDEQGRG